MPTPMTTTTATTAPTMVVMLFADSAGEVLLFVVVGTLNVMDGRSVEVVDVGKVFSIESFVAFFTSPEVVVSVPVIKVEESFEDAKSGIVMFSVGISEQSSLR